MNWLIPVSRCLLQEWILFITPFFVIENAQVDYLLAKPVDISFSIGFFDAYEYHEALSNGGFAGSVDGDGSVSGTLYHYSHVVLAFLRGQSYELIRCVHGSAG